MQSNGSTDTETIISIVKQLMGHSMPLTKLGMCMHTNKIRTHGEKIFDIPFVA